MMVTKVMAMLTWQTFCWPGCGESLLPRMESFEHFVGCPLAVGLADPDPGNCGGHSNVMLPHNPPLESQYNIKHGPDLTTAITSLAAVWGLHPPQWADSAKLCF